MVKVGNSECEFLKLTPLSRSSAMAGAVCGVTIRPRRPSGTNRIRLCGVPFCADAAPDKTSKLVATAAILRRMDNSLRANSAQASRCLCLVLLCDGFVTSVPDNYTPCGIPRPGRRPPNKTSDPGLSGQDNCGIPAGDRRRHCR